jgi:uncharacterized phage-associated protein
MIEHMFGPKRTPGMREPVAVLRPVVATWTEPSEERLAELILYVALGLLDDKHGGATKVNKVLFYAEFTHIREHGVPITGVPYQRLPQGPAPRRLLPIREQLIANGDAKIERETVFGRPQDRLVPLREIRSDVFSQTERDTIENVIDALWGKTAAQVSAMSHEELGWLMVADGEDIPLATAYLPPQAAMSEGAKRRARELAATLSQSS